MTETNANVVEVLQEISKSMWEVLDRLDADNAAIMLGWLAHNYINKCNNRQDAFEAIMNAADPTNEFGNTFPRKRALTKTDAR
jgi:hypothetical protein